MNLKKLMIVIALLAIGTMAFALGARESMTEDEALAALELKIVELGLMIGQYMAMGRLLVITGTHEGACEIYVPPS